MGRSWDALTANSALPKGLVQAVSEAVNAAMGAAVLRERSRLRTAVLAVQATSAVTVLPRCEGDVKSVRRITVLFDG